MIRLELATEMAAPIERCFDLSRSIDLHLESEIWSGEQAIAGVTRGLIGSGEEVTWRGRHFGLIFTHTSRITAYDLPPTFRTRWCGALSAAIATIIISQPANGERR